MMTLPLRIPETRPSVPQFDRRLAPPIVIIVLMALVGLLGPHLAANDPSTVALGDRLLPPIGFGGSSAHPLGTDSLGRDVLARVLAGARISLLIALSATLLAGIIGTTAGTIGGFLGGRWDAAFTWLGDVQMAIPFVVVAIGVAVSLDTSALTVVLILGFTGWATYARVARLAAQPLQTAGFVESARVSGASGRRIVGRHVLPVILPPLVAIACQQAGALMLYEAALSFLGLGVPPGTITWGGMIADSRETAQVAWWATVAPGIAIVLTVFGFNAIGSAVTRRLLGMRV